MSPVPFSYTFLNALLYRWVSFWTNYIYTRHYSCLKVLSTSEGQQKLISTHQVGFGGVIAQSGTEGGELGVQFSIFPLHAVPL